MIKPAIAIVGYSRSGKGQVAKNLRDRGFRLFSGGDHLRSLALKEGRSIERIDLIEYANELRAKQGADFLMRDLVQISREVDQGSEHKGLAIDSLRNPGEVKFLKDNLGALVLNIDATDELRWERTKANPKEGDPENWYEFIGLTAIDHGYGQESTGQNIAECVALADLTIQNNGTREELAARVDELLISSGIIEGNRRSERL